MSLYHNYRNKRFDRIVGIIFLPVGIYLACRCIPYWGTSKFLPAGSITGILIVFAVASLVEGFWKEKE